MNNINLVGLLFALIAYLELTKEHFDIKRIKGGLPKKEEEESSGEESSGEESSAEEANEEDDEGISNTTMIGGGIGIVLLVALCGAAYLYFIDNPEEAPGQGVLNEAAGALSEVGKKAGEISASAIDNATEMYDAPPVEAPVVEAPVVEAPVVEAPVVEAPVDIPPQEGGNIIGGTIKKLKSQLKSLKRK